MPVVIVFPDEMSQEEALKYVADEKQRWLQSGKTLAKVELRIDGDEVVITATEKSPISRVRRITGYLSNLSNFNDAKTAEESQRKKHI